MKIAETIASALNHDWHVSICFIVVFFEPDFLRPRLGGDGLGVGHLHLGTAKVGRLRLGVLGVVVRDGRLDGTEMKMPDAEPIAA